MSSDEHLDAIGELAKAANRIAKAIEDFDPMSGRSRKDFVAENAARFIEASIRFNGRVTGIPTISVKEACDLARDLYNEAHRTG